MSADSMPPALAFPVSGIHFASMPPFPITLYRTPAGLVAQRGEDCFFLANADFDEVFRQADPAAWLEPQLRYGQPINHPADLLAPIQSQEVWAAGVTYLRSRDARMEESKDGGSVYDRVYAADRPEIFFKATPHRVVGPGAAVRIRADSKWNVPEPEVTLAINRDGKIFGYTIGNDMSSRDIEGENPLYLPQAKVYTGCCALGPGLVVRPPLPHETTIAITIHRAGADVFAGQTSLTQMKRTFPELAAWLCREQEFPAGCYLLTGTGLVPPNDFTLAPGDEVAITIAGLGMLRNVVSR
jgi:2-dehydro-3-deoxy-D-arabinonate dehydratase